MLPLKAMDHPATRRVITAATTAGLEIDVVTFAKSTRTAEEAAAAVGCQVAQIVKSLCFMVDNRPVLALVSGGNRLDEKKLAALHGVGRKKVKRASADQVREATGFAIGGVAPFGHPTSLPIYLDADLMAFDEVWAAAGTPTAVFPVTPTALQAATHAHVTNIKKD